NLSCGNPSAEIAAAKAILDNGLRGVEVADLAERIGQLEQRLGERDDEPVDPEGEGGPAAEGAAGAGPAQGADPGPAEGGSGPGAGWPVGRPVAEPLFAVPAAADLGPLF